MKNHWIWFVLIAMLVGMVEGAAVYRPRKNESTQSTQSHVQPQTGGVGLSGGKVVPPGLVVGEDGQIEGVTSSRGRVFDNGNVIGTVGADGTAYDKNGKVIGRNTGGERLFFDDQGRVISPEEASRVCDRNQKNEEFCVQKKFDGGPFDSLDDAVLAAADGLNSSECKVSRPRIDPKWDAGVGVEAGLNLYRESNAGGKFFFGYKAWYTDRGLAAKQAPSPSDDLNLTGFSLVGHLHNHPNTVPGYKSDFFSLSDWNAARSRNVPSYMMTCFLNGGGTTPRMLRLDPSTGDVHERAVLMGADGRLSYGGGWSAKPIYNFNGVLGWCECGNANCGSTSLMGVFWIPMSEMEKCCDVIEKICGGQWSVKDRYKQVHERLIRECDGQGVFYLLCLKCGKIVRNWCVKPGEFSSHIGKLAKLEKSDDVLGWANLSIQSPELCRIQDGKVVVKGVCKCSSPREVKANSWTEVCRVCGRLILKE